MKRKNKKLAAYRKMIDFTQANMAKEIGIGITTYNLKETGKLPFDQFEIERIMGILRKFFPELTADEVFFTQ